MQPYSYASLPSHQLNKLYLAITLGNSTLLFKGCYFAVSAVMTVGGSLLTNLTDLQEPILATTGNSYIFELIYDVKQSEHTLCS